MPYAYVADVKLYRGIAPTETDDDTLIQELVDAAQSQIDSYCGRTFDAGTPSTRYYDAVEDVDQNGTRLWLGTDCCAVVTITNGTGTAVTKYVTEPRNTTPFYAIRLKDSAGELFGYETDPQDAITVLGRWAYSVTVPPAIHQAAVRLAAYMYAQKDAQVFETTLFPDAGVMTVPQGLPRDVEQLLKPFRKL